MPSLTCFNRRFTPRWSMIIITTIFVAFFIRLGFWQIHRADEKKHMLVAQANQVKAPAQWWMGGEKAPAQYQNIKVRGHYLPTILLLDNQHYKHEFGYDVLSPLELSDGKVIVIDRGWVPAGRSRQSFPQVKPLSDDAEVLGTVYFPSANQWILGPASEQKANNLTLVEGINAKLLSQVLQKKVYPFIIRLDKQDANGFVRDWAIVSMPPERHLGYALQWFAMALVILIIFVALNLKKENEETTI